MAVWAKPMQVRQEDVETWVDLKRAEAGSLRRHAQADSPPPDVLHSHLPTPSESTSPEPMLPSPLSPSSEFVPEPPYSMTTKLEPLNIPPITAIASSPTTFAFRPSPYNNLPLSTSNVVGDVPMQDPRSLVPAVGTLSSSTRRPSMTARERLPTLALGGDSDVVMVDMTNPVIPATMPYHPPTRPRKSTTTSVPPPPRVHPVHGSGWPPVSSQRHPISHLSIDTPSPPAPAKQEEESVSL
jgi:hypothetical protein